MRADEKPGMLIMRLISYFTQKIKRNTQYSAKKINQTSQR